MVIWNPVPPAAMELGTRPLIAGGAAAGGLITKFKAPEVTPSGLTTVTPAEPALRINAAGTWARNCVALLKLVASCPRFQCTLELCTKPLPDTVRVNAGAP